MSVHIDYDPKRALYLRYNKAWLDATVKLIEKSIPSEYFGARSKVLEIGCGRGETLKALSALGYECYGIDIDPECVRMSGKYGDVRCADAMTADELFPAGSVDAVVLVHVLEHVSNPSALVEKLAKISRRYIVLAVPNLASTLTFWQGVRQRRPVLINKGHQVGWDPSHLRTFLEVTCNLRILDWMPDRVLIPNRLSSLFEMIGGLDKMELEVLPRFFPLLSNSLIVICEKKEAAL